MSLNILLDHVLKYAKKTGQEIGAKSRAANDDKSPLPSINPIATGTAVIGTLSSLFGKKGGGLAKVGSAAALGALAYQAYKAYNQNNTPAAEAFERTGTAAENAGRAILRAMIAAAAADGEIDANERTLINQEGNNDPAITQWLAQEMTRPASVAEIAQDVNGDAALAAETYLAARLVCGELSRKEIVFLSQLSTALNLDDKLVENLEKQAGL